MFNVVKGDLIKFVVASGASVAHGCNCFCNMGAGVAVPIRQMWPEMYAADQRTPVASYAKLGTFSYAKLGHTQYGFNLYTQYNYGSGILFQLEALESALTGALAQLSVCPWAKQHLAVPLIGGGLGRGDPKEIKDMMKKVSDKFPDIELTLVLL